MDEQSGETGEEEVIGEVVGESEVEELVPEWGWRRDNGSWFQNKADSKTRDKHGKVYRLWLKQHLTYYRKHQTAIVCTPHWENYTGSDRLKTVTSTQKEKSIIGKWNAIAKWSKAKQKKEEGRRHSNKLSWLKSLQTTYCRWGLMYFPTPDLKTFGLLSSPEDFWAGFLMAAAASSAALANASVLSVFSWQQMHTHTYTSRLTNIFRVERRWVLIV